jgi:GNAT superfamily N-acetyltransferase
VGATSGDGRTRYSLLLDTNAFIALEPTTTNLEPRLQPAAELVRLAQADGHRIFLASATIRDIEHDRNSSRRAANLALARKYAILARVEAPEALLRALGEDAPPRARDSNNDNDLEMLSALWCNAADFLVTDDERLRRRGARAGLQERVFTVAEAAAFFERLVPRLSVPPPAVEHLLTYQLVADDPIFASLRDDYGPAFDGWVRKAQSEHRPAWVIRGANGYAAVMIVKHEPAGEMGLVGSVLKVSTFKVAPDAAGRSYGELLLKTLFGYAQSADVDTLYVTAFPEHARLIELLEVFGFRHHSTRTTNGRDEHRYDKTRRPVVLDGLEPLEAHRRFGPPFIHPDARLFVVPIIPEWHEALFPEFELTLDIGTGVHPYGNALRKAYVSGSRSRLVGPGDTLLFYRSEDYQAVTVVGVVDDVQVSADPEAVGRFVGRRTVYTADDLQSMAWDHGELHAMLFRQDRILDEPWTLRSLRMIGALNGPPQSITQVREGGRSWVHQQLAGSQ